MLKIYLFVMFNIATLILLGLSLDLLGTANNASVLMGIILLISIPFVYVLGLKRFEYWEQIKFKLSHLKDIINGDL